MAETFIVKLQMPIASNRKNPPILVYNEDRSICEQFHKLSKGLIDLMNGEAKKYFYAHLEDDVLSIDKEAPEQDW